MVKLVPVPNWPLLHSWCQIGPVPNWYRCQIDSFTLLVSNWYRCQIDSFTLLVPNCPPQTLGAKLTPVSNWCWCQIVLQPLFVCLFTFFKWGNASRVSRRPRMLRRPAHCSASPVPARLLLHIHAPALRRPDSSYLCTNNQENQMPRSKIKHTELSKDKLILWLLPFPCLGDGTPESWQDSGSAHKCKTPPSAPWSCRELLGRHRLVKARSRLQAAARGARARKRISQITLNLSCNKRDSFTNLSPLHS